jgi:hypothetical protein
MNVESFLLKIVEFIFNFYRNRKDIRSQVNRKRKQKVGKVPNETRKEKKK